MKGIIHYDTTIIPKLDCQNVNVTIVRMICTIVSLFLKKIYG